MNNINIKDYEKVSETDSVYFKTPTSKEDCEKLAQIFNDKIFKSA